MFDATGCKEADENETGMLMKQICRGGLIINVLRGKVRATGFGHKTKVDNFLYPCCYGTATFDTSRGSEWPGT